MATVSIGTKYNSSNEGTCAHICSHPSSFGPSDEQHCDVVSTDQDRTIISQKDLSDSSSSIHSSSTTTTPVAMSAQTEVQYIYELGENDVLMGRGGGSNGNIGNIKFRQLVSQHKKRYFAVSKSNKPKVARQLVALWHQMTPRGRFVARVENNKDQTASTNDGANTVWYEVPDKKAREKASQCLRERKPYVTNPSYMKRNTEQLQRQRKREQEQQSIADSNNGSHPAPRVGAQAIYQQHPSKGLQNDRLNPHFEGSSQEEEMMLRDHTLKLMQLKIQMQQIQIRRLQQSLHSEQQQLQQQQEDPLMTSMASRVVSRECDPRTRTPPIGRLISLSNVSESSSSNYASNVHQQHWGNSHNQNFQFDQQRLGKSNSHSHTNCRNENGKRALDIHDEGVLNNSELKKNRHDLEKIVHIEGLPREDEHEEPPKPKRRSSVASSVFGGGDFFSVVSENVSAFDSDDDVILKFDDA